jgi:hypothetical protein
MDKLGFTIAEALARVPFGRSKLYELIASGALRARHCGRRVVILHDDLVACLDALPGVDADRKRQRRGSVS